ncbi:MAG TPA: phosphatase PAP2 family protein [Nitrospiraceae bacterium]|nr:phosphatase PAP2 family protein [Nitrospiraceae bacterium]
MNWDVAVLYAINGLAEQSALLDAMMLALARPSSLVIPAFCVFGYWVWMDRREAFIGAAVLTALVAFGDLLGAQVKHAVARSRPCWLLDGIHQLAGCGGTFSFPSNHALNTAAAAAFAQVLYPWTGWITWPLVTLIGFSRVYVGAHFFSDVIGGWIIGAILGIGTALLLARSKFFQTGAGHEARG